MTRAMKETDIEWCSTIPENWEVKANKHIMSKCKELCTNYNGEDILSLTMKGVIVRDLEAGGKMPTSFDGYQRIYPNNLLMCLFDYDVTPRCIGLIKNNGLTSPAYSQFVMKDGNSSRYYYYYYLMIDHTKELLHLAKNLRHSFTEDQLGAIKTPVPPIDEQNKIADFLDKKCKHIDAVLEKTRASIDEYKQLKQSVITEAVTKGIRPNRPMKDSGIEWVGEMPEDWKIIKLKHTVSSISDIDHYMPETVENGYPYLMTGDLKDYASKINFKVCKKISNSDFTKLSSKIHPMLGDVIFARYATIGTVCYVDVNENFLVSYSCLTIRPNKNKIEGKFLYYYLKSEIFKTDVSQYINSNTQANVGLDSLQKIYILLPNNNEQLLITSYLDSKCSEIDKLIAKKEQLIEELETYKKSLIYEYVTGKKEVC